MIVTISGQIENRTALLSKLLLCVVKNKNVRMKKLFTVLFAFSILQAMAQTTYKTVGIIERFDNSLDQIVSKDAKPEIIAEGFKWSEGPL